MNTTVRAARVRKSAEKLNEGLVWAEVYLPFDAEAFSAFVALAQKSPGADWPAKVAAAAAADPVLASKALDPIDAHGEAMLPEDLQGFAHSFLDESRQIDVMHSFERVGTVKVAQSFVNTPEIGSSKFYPGAWVLALQVAPGSEVWKAVDEGKLDALSFATTVRKVRITAAKPAQQEAA